MFLISDFQRDHTDHLGQPLKADGVIGERTQWALDLASHVMPRQRIIATALGFVGVTESSQGSNRGPEIDAWTRRCGVGVGVPWCASFVSWCMSQPGLPEIKEGSVLKLSHLLPVITEPLPGDVMFFMHDATTGHCGLLLGADRGTIMTVEGNSMNAVRVVTRDMGSVKFLRSVAPSQIPGIPSGVKPATTITR